MAFNGKEFKGPNGVNVAEILRVADAIERSETFTMKLEYHPCGTPACILGHTLPNVSGWKDELYDQAGELLGLPDERQYMELFQPRTEVANWSSRPYSDSYITNAHAAACLRKLAETGVVDWAGTKPA
jgi:hypothetical protein